MEYERDIASRTCRWLLWVTVVECIGVLAIAVTTFVNLMPMWMATPEAAELTDYARYVTTGYGLWGAGWAIPSYVMLTTTDDDARRRFARLTGAFYLLWWVLFWEQCWNHTWHHWVIALYLPLRAWQLVGHLAYGFAPRTSR